MSTQYQIEVLERVRLKLAVIDDAVTSIAMDDYDNIDDRDLHALLDDRLGKISHARASMSLKVIHKINALKLCQELENE